jgi:hypothetical protein
VVGRRPRVDDQVALFSLNSVNQYGTAENFFYDDVIQGVFSISVSFLLLAAL